MKFTKLIFASLMLLSAQAFAFTCTIGSPTAGTIYNTADPLIPVVVAKYMRPTGTNDLTIVYDSGASFTIPASSNCGGWSSIVSGNPKFFQSFDGTNGAGNTATAGLDAGYDAVAFLKVNIRNIQGNVATKCATYALPGGLTGALCTTGYLDWIVYRP